MCDPVTIGIALATTAAQSYFQNQAAGDVRKAQTRAQTMFDDDVKNQRDTSNIQFQNSVQQAGQGADEQRYEEAVAKRTTANQPSFDQRALLPGQGNASNAVKTAIVQSQDKGISDNAAQRQQTPNLGPMGMPRSVRTLTCNATLIVSRHKVISPKDRSIICKQICVLRSMLATRTLVSLT